LQFEPAGWASLMVAVLVLGGIQLACLGILGEYIGRTFLHLNKRPQYVIRERTERLQADHEEMFTSASQRSESKLPAI